MASSPELYEKIKALSLDKPEDARPGTIVVAEQFGWLRIALLLNIGSNGIQMTSRGKIVNDGGWFYSFDELEPKNIFLMPIEVELSDLKGVWPEDEWQQGIESQWDKFFAIPEHRKIREMYQNELEETS